MRIHHSSLILTLVAALSACPSVQSSALQGTPPISQGSASSPGQVVTEIDPRIWVIHQGRNGDYWFGSNGNGVYRYDGQQVTQYTEEDGLGGVQVRNIVEDAQGHLFISTHKGVSKFDGESFKVLEVVETSSPDEAWRLHPDDVWIVYAPGNSGPCRYDGEKLYHLKLSKSPVEDEFRATNPGVTFSPSDLYSIYKDRRGHMWFGTANAGLCRYDGETLSWMVEEQLTMTPSGGAFGIRSIYEDRAGDFWVCNTRQRFEISPEVLVENGYSLIQYEKKEGWPDAKSDTDENFDFYSSMLEDDAGALWMVSGTDGAWKYDGEGVTKHLMGDGAYALCIELDQQGKLWVGTLEHGIFVSEGEGFEPFQP